MPARVLSQSKLPERSCPSTLHPSARRRCFVDSELRAENRRLFISPPKPKNRQEPKDRLLVPGWGTGAFWTPCSQAGGSSHSSMASWEDISLQPLLSPEPEVTPSSAETSEPLSRAGTGLSDRGRRGDEEAEESGGGRRGMGGLEGSLMGLVGTSPRHVLSWGHGHTSCSNAQASLNRVLGEVRCLISKTPPPP